MTHTYYNEYDPYCVAWLHNLIDTGHLPPGCVDSRDIRSLTPGDVEPYTAAHFFSGLGGWPYALQLARWPSDVPLWTASCPCQPFSAAGQRRGTDDERHLWPVLYELLRVCRPQYVVGEQVASAIGYGWLDGIRTDLEAEGYTVGSVVLGAHSVGAPHIRQRLYWVAHTLQPEFSGWAEQPAWEACETAQRSGGVSGLANARYAERGQGHQPCAVGRSHALRPAREESAIEPGEYSTTYRMGHAALNGNGPQYGESCQSTRPEEPAGGSSLSGGLGQPNGPGWEPGEPPSQATGYGRAAESTGGTDGMEHADLASSHQRPRRWEQSVHDTCPPGGFWDAYDLLPCRDGKTRRIESGLQPLAHGVSARMGKLRAYGNAIVPQVDATFINAFMEIQGLIPGPPEGDTP